MTRDDIEELFVMLGGYWPHSAPDVGDTVAESAWLAMLHEVDSGRVADAVIGLARDGEAFCPVPGVVYHRATLVRSPASVEFDHTPVLEPAAPEPAEVEPDGSWLDAEGFRYDRAGRLDLPHLLAKTKAELRGKRGEAMFGAVLDGLAR